MSPVRLPTPDEIAGRILARSMPEPNTGCWLWLGTVTPEGYGNFHYASYTNAHRASYGVFVGPIPDGTEIDHLCHVTSCVNPQHLEAVTHRVNMERYRRPERCPSGHPYSLDNTYFIRQGGKYRSGPTRRCKTCEQARAKRLYWAKKERVTR